MPTKNIFAGFGVRSEFVNLIYTELMKREFVSYSDVLALFFDMSKDYNDKYNSVIGYDKQKKAFPEVLNALKRLVLAELRINKQSRCKEQSDTLPKKR